MNKKILILLIAIFLLNIAIIKASITIDHKCEDYRCKEGTDITYSIKIRNNIEKDIVVNYIKVKNELDENIATQDGIQYLLRQNESNTFEITEKVPLPPRGGYSLKYYACFGVTILYPDNMAVEEICGDVRKSLTVLPLSKVQCQENKDCESNEYCNVEFFKCKDIECNGFVFNHKCINYFVVVIPVSIAIILLITLIIRENKKYKKLKRKKS